MGSDENVNVTAARFLHERGMKARDWTNLVFVAEALRRGLELAIDPERSRILVRCDQREHWWKSGVNSLNTRLLKRITMNKDVASRFLRSQGVHALDNAVFGVEDGPRAWAWGEKYSALVVKPVSATQGIDVHVGLDSRASFIRTFDQVVSAHGAALVEEYVSGREYRFLVVDNQTVAVTQMRPANVVGDGESTITELVAMKNRKRPQSPIHRVLDLGQKEVELLQTLGYSPRSVPSYGEVIHLRRTSNLQTMGDAVDATDIIDSDYKLTVEHAARALPGGVILGFDVLIDPSAPIPARIVEVNSAPMISIHHLPWEGAPRDAAGAVLNMMCSSYADEPRTQSELEIPVAEILTRFAPRQNVLRRRLGKVRDLLRPLGWLR